MNAGAEYVAYRIWATLQEDRGIHPASLLTCLGALAGYACQACVRKTASLPGIDPSRYVLTPVDPGDGAMYVHGAALNQPLVESPLSVWSLVSRTVQKLGEPLPDLDDIVNHSARTLGTSEFGVPRVPDEHRPRHSAIFYLTQIWPQILPIAQRFCSRPMQIPVLFGIALQRAIEQIKDELSPTLSASIAMECAVAMSKVVLPGAGSGPGTLANTSANTSANTLANPSADTPADTLAASILPAAAGLPMKAGPPLSAASGALTESQFGRTAKPSRKRKRTAPDDDSGPGIGAWLGRVPQSARVGMIVSVAFIAVVAAMHKPNRSAVPDTASVERPLQTRPFGDGLPAPAPEPFLQVAQVSEDLPPPEESAAPAAAVQAPVELLPDEAPVQPEVEVRNPDGFDEMVIRE
jgi:hypothetical protein